MRSVRFEVTRQLNQILGSKRSRRPSFTVIAETLELYVHSKGGREREVRVPGVVKDAIDM